MNKRSTEGYVLAYVLIVIAVMGMIAATLMTSTLQVVKAQENSIEYMKDKYAAMGEIERLVAYLDNFDPLLTSTTCSDEAASVESAIEKFESYLADDALFNLSRYPLITAFSVSSEPDHNTITIHTKAVKNTASVSVSFTFILEITTSSEYHEITEDDLTTPENESSGHPDFTSTVMGADSFVFNSYEITQVEVTPNA